MSPPSKAAKASNAWKWLLALGMTAIVTLMLLFLAGVFHRKVPTEAAEGPSRSAAGVNTVAARMLTRPRYETATGTIKPVHEAAVAARLLAKVLEINVTAGQTVTKDQVLVKLEDADLQARLKQAEAGLSSAQVRSEQTKADFGRAEQLKAKKAISQAEFDNIQSAMKAAEADLARATQAVQESQVMLDYATIRSPLSGTVVDKRVEVGDTVGPGQIMLTLFSAESGAIRSYLPHRTNLPGVESFDHPDCLLRHRGARGAVHHSARRRSADCGAARGHLCQLSGTLRVRSRAAGFFAAGTQAVSD